jgi:hypothetical protein
MGKTVKVKICDIKYDFYVRAKPPDDDRIMYFAELYEAGAEVTPILVTKDLRLVEGRTRTEGAKLAGLTEIDATLVSETDEIALIIIAFTANAGGPLPPRREDFRHTIQHLIEKGASYRKIVDSLQGILPLGMLRRFYRDALTLVNKNKVGEAIRLMTKHELSVSKAAAQVGIDQKILRNELDKLSGKKPPNSGRIVAIEKKLLLARYNNLNKSNGQAAGKILQSLEKGEIAPEDVHSYLEYWAKLSGHSENRVIDWIRRWQAKRPAAKAA